MDMNKVEVEKNKLKSVCAEITKDRDKQNMRHRFVVNGFKFDVKITPCGTNKKRRREREYSEDYLDMLFFAEKQIQRGEMTREEVNKQLEGINPYKFMYNE